MSELSAAGTPQSTQLPTIHESLGQPLPGRDTAKRAGSNDNDKSDHRSSHPSWPAQRKAHGLLTIKASPNHSKALRAQCSVQHGELTLNIARASRESSGDSSGSSDTVVVATVPLEDLAVGLQRGRNDMFIIATRYKNKLYDDISCFADNQEKRNKWIAVLRRMGVPIFDLSVLDGRNTVWRPVVRQRL